LVADNRSSLPAVLAIDGGNSKTDVALVAADGTLLASVRGPGANQEHVGIDGAMRVLGEIVEDAAAKAGVASGGLVAGHTSGCLAGADLPEEEEQLAAAVRDQGWSVTSAVANDTFAVLRAGLTPAPGGPPWGVAVTCGAGINCVGMAPDGRTTRFLAIRRLTGDWRSSAASPPPRRAPCRTSPTSRRWSARPCWASTIWARPRTPSAASAPLPARASSPASNIHHWSRESQVSLGYVL
jgi:hypothetical protein